MTVILAIDPTDAGNGATEVFPGYHRSGLPLGEGRRLPRVAAVTTSTCREASCLDLQPGDLAIFSGFTPHRSAPNSSDRWRRQLYLSYNAGRDGGDQRQAHYRQFHQWLKEKYAAYGKTRRLLSLARSGAGPCSVGIVGRGTRTPNNLKS